MQKKDKAKPVQDFDIDDACETYRMATPSGIGVNKLNKVLSGELALILTKLP